MARAQTSVEYLLLVGGGLLLVLIAVTAALTSGQNIKAEIETYQTGEYSFPTTSACSSDVRITSVSVAGSPAVGAATTVTVTVSASATTYYNVYLQDTTDNSQITGTAGPNISSGSGNGTYSFTWFPRTEGTHTLRAEVVPTNCKDPDQANNVALTTADVSPGTPEYDVAVVFEAFPSYVVLGTHTVIVDVCNVGNREISGTVRFSDTTEGTATTQSFPTLSVGDCVPLSFTWSPGVAGTHTLEVELVDSSPLDMNPANDSDTIVVEVGWERVLYLSEVVRRTGREECAAIDYVLNTLLSNPSMWNGVTVWRIVVDTSRPLLNEELPPRDDDVCINVKYVYPGRVIIDLQGNEIVAYPGARYPFSVAVQVNTTGFSNVEIRNGTLDCTSISADSCVKALSGGVELNGVTIKDVGTYTAAPVYLNGGTLLFNNVSLSITDTTTGVFFSILDGNFYIVPGTGVYFVLP